VLYSDVVKVDQDVAHIGMTMRTFREYVLNVSSGPDVCCKCFI
jgi:hypothetical protein